MLIPPSPRPIGNRKAARLGFLGALVLALCSATACGPKYPKCDKDDQCASKNEVCVEGTCQQCRDDGQCLANLQCKGGRCEQKDECSADNDCKESKVCRSGKCQTECTESTDCGAGLKCNKNRCVTSAASCNSDADCAAGEACVNGHCGTTESASRNMDVCDPMPVVGFGFNDSNLTTDSRSTLAQVAECLKTHNGAITIEGHCDERGTEEFNLALGDRRARAVEKYLISLGIPAAKLNVLSKGELEPLDPSHTEQAWAKNRRAQFVTR